MQTIGSQEKDSYFSLYFHIPFCTKKCPYCHFFVLPNKEELRVQYLEALHREIDLVLKDVKDKEIVSIYFGGGTPFLIGPKALDGIFQHLKSLGLNISTECEITLEMNPEDSLSPWLKEYHSLGVNRLSIGVQSLDDSELITLGRTHSSNQSVQAIENAYNAGFRNISIDLMYDVPTQKKESWWKTVDKVENLPITHLSLYNLTIEPHTGFHKRRKEIEKTLPSEEESLSFLNYAVEKLEKFGLKRYEISAFAKEGYHSRHNTGYWLGREFLGLGPSAFSFRNQERFRNVCNLSRYYSDLEKGLLPIDFREKLPFPHNLYELLAVNIRLVEGVDLDLFQQKWGKLPEECFKTLKDLHSEGLINYSSSHVSLTSKGQLFYDSVASEIV